MSQTTSTRTRQLPTWFVVLIFSLAVIATVAVSRRPTNKPPPLPELAQRIQAACPEWRILPMHPDAAGGDLRWGFWICAGNQTPAELWLLNHTCESAPSWTRVVVCLSYRPQEECEGYQIEGENFQLFGDPEMLRRIAGLLSKLGQKVGNGVRNRLN